MARSSKADTARHHEELIDAASRLFREHGVDSVSVPDVMGEIGLTRGGFYKHFGSKELLVEAAVGAAFDEHIARLDGMSEQHGGDRAATRAAFLDFCLSPANRDDPGNGCPSPLASAAAQSEPDAAARTAFTDGVRTLLDALTDRAGGDTEDRESQILADMATVVGAITLARATAGDPISDAILAASRSRLG